MCRVSPYKGQTCKHRWFALIEPCIPGMSFHTAPPGHRFNRPQTFLGSTSWFPAPPGSCPDCGLKGRYDGDKVRFYLGKGSAGEKQGARGMWGPYGNGYWPNQNGGYGGAGWYGQQQQMGGYTPGHVAVMGQGGYSWNGAYVGNPYGMRRGGRFGCFGL